MNRAWTQPGESSLVCGGAVALVPGEAVTGKTLIHLDHQAIPVDLGNNGSTCDRKTDAISMVEAVLRLEQSRDGSAINQHVLRRRSSSDSTARRIALRPA